MRIIQGPDHGRLSAYVSNFAVMSRVGRWARHLWLSTPLSWRVQKFRRARELVKWNLTGRKGPPPHLHKRAVVESYLHQFSLKTVVETGTYLGDMVEGLVSVASRIYSIELDPWLYHRAQRRFANHSNVALLLGDSTHQLGTVIPDLDRPALFWLDGHYSGGITARGEVDTPIVAELAHILSDAKDHIVLVDDANAFDGTNGYPTVASLRALVERLRPDYLLEVESNIIRLTPSHSLGLRGSALDIVAV